MNILLLSAYDTPSHRNWREQLVAALPLYDWQVLTLPPRHFSWRIRGNSLSWALSEEAVLNRRYDVVLATSMVDLAGLRGLVPALARVPALLYCHENQFAYPRSARQHPGVEPQIVNLYSLLAADRVLFNSAFNRDSCLRGIDDLLRRLPDAVPPGVAARIAQRSEVLPVPLPLDLPTPADRSTTRTARVTGAPLELVWNHRWEYDKGPEGLLAAVAALLERGVRFRLHLLGQRFRRVPEAFAALHALLLARSPESLGQWGPLPRRRDYLRQLLAADVVLSTALHEFQGLAVQEAVACGCVPLVPDRLSYPEWFAADYRYAGADTHGEARMLASRLAAWQRDGLPQAPDLASLRWEALATHYRRHLQALAGRGQGAGPPLS